MIKQEYIDEMLKWNMGSSLCSLWLWSRNYPDFSGNLNEAKKGFFFLAEKLMREGVLKLAHEGKFLDGSIGEQLDGFRRVWPEKYDATKEEEDIDNLWWALYAPAGAVWVYPDGEEVWT